MGRRRKDGSSPLFEGTFGMKDPNTTKLGEGPISGSGTGFRGVFNEVMKQAVYASGGVPKTVAASMPGGKGKVSFGGGKAGLFNYASVYKPREGTKSEGQPLQKKAAPKTSKLKISGTGSGGGTGYGGDLNI